MTHRLLRNELGRKAVTSEEIAAAIGLIVIGWTRCEAAAREALAKISAPYDEAAQLEAYKLRKRNLGKHLKDASQTRLDMPAELLDCIVSAADWFEALSELRNDAAHDIRASFFDEDLSFRKIDAGKNEMRFGEKIHVDAEELNRTAQEIFDCSEYLRDIAKCASIANLPGNVGLLAFKPPPWDYTLLQYLPRAVGEPRKLNPRRSQMA